MPFAFAFWLIVTARRTNKEITKWVSELTSKEEAREVIQDGLPEIEKIAEKVVAEQNSAQDVKVEFGQVEFPTKLYGEFLYPAGKYEAILITLGEGTGANWWCVLFPPLCFLDFSNGVAVSEGFDEKDTDDKVGAKENEKAEKKDKAKATEKTEAQSEPKNDSPTREESAETGDTSEEPLKKDEEQTANHAETETASEGKRGEHVEPTAAAKTEEETAAEVKAGEGEQQDTDEKKQELILTEEDEVEVKFFIKEVWDKIFG